MNEKRLDELEARASGIAGLVLAIRSTRRLIERIGACNKATLFDANGSGVVSVSSKLHGNSISSIIAITQDEYRARLPALESELKALLKKGA